jgi:hypothetical protein
VRRLKSCQRQLPTFVTLQSTLGRQEQGNAVKSYAYQVSFCKSSFKCPNPYGKPLRVRRNITRRGDNAGGNSQMVSILRGARGTTLVHASSEITGEVENDAASLWRRNGMYVGGFSFDIDPTEVSRWIIEKCRSGSTLLHPILNRIRRGSLVNLIHEKVFCLLNALFVVL